MEKSKISTQLIASFFATIAMTCTGFNMGWASPSLPKLLAEDSDIPITSDQSSWIVSFWAIGAVLGILPGAGMIDRYGRKKFLLLGVIPQVSSYILIGLAPNYWLLAVGRIACGIASGMSMLAMPSYLGEIAEDRIRGALGTMLNVMLNAGMLLVYCVGPWVSRAALAAVGGAIGLAFGMTFIWVWESPYFYVMKGDLVRAEKSLLWLRGKKSVDEELVKIQESVEYDQQNAGTMKDLIMVPGNRKSLIIVCGLMVAQQLSGIGAIVSYSNLILSASDSTLDANISVIIIGIVQLVGGVVTIFTVDLAGRRPLLLTSAGGAILFLVGEALYFQLQALGNDVSGISWLPVTAMVGYIIFYAAGLGCLPHVILSEMFPCNLKALATMIFSLFGGGLGVVIPKVYQIVADAYGIHVCFWGFSAITLCFSILFFFILPETKQKSLQRIQEEIHKTTESKTQLHNSGF